ncbi:MAG: neutral/alkaline non-lysosomal ceramidase N-terminal domain-containing protein [Planctomycetaceae bacterium]
MVSRLWMVLLLTWGSVATATSRTDGGELRAGAFAMDVTPLKFPVSMNGNMQDAPAKRAADPLHARCLVLDDGETRVAFIVVDNCVIRRELMDDAKQRAHKLTGIPTDRILISSTHAHSCPTVTGAFQSEPIVEYVEFLTERIAAGIKQANDNLAPARIAWGVGRDETQVFNRRWWLKEPSSESNPFGLIDQARMNPGYNNPKVTKSVGPVDPEVSFLSVRSPDGQPRAFLANYSLHYVGGTGGDLSADYFGAFAERIGQLLKADQSGKTPFVGIMSNGTSGDVNNINFALTMPPKYEPFEKIKLVANSVATVAHAAQEKAEYRSTTTIAMRETEIELKVRKPSADDIAAAKARIEKAGPFPYKTMPDVYARETLLMADFPDTVKLKLQAIRIGELGIVAIPAEVFTEIGLEIKRRSPLKPTFTISLANGWDGYLPTPQQHELAGYETWRARSSYLEVGASPKIVEALLKLLNEVAK